MNKLRQHIHMLVNSANIRRGVDLNGKSHTVVTSMTLPFDVVMNDILYTKEQILANYMKLDGTPAPLGHPKDSSGKFISAKSQEGRNLSDIGAWNKNPQIVGNRVQLETWIDEEVAGRTQGGRDLLKALDDGKPISTSVAVLANAKEAPKGIKDFKFVADIIDMDHNAFLLNEPPAAGVDKGVGVFVNSSTAVEYLEQSEQEQSIIEKVYNKIMSKFQDKNSLIVNEEGTKMEKDTELHGKIDRLNESVGELVSIMKEKFEKKEDEVLANEMKAIKELLLVNSNKELAEKRAKVAVILGNEEVTKTMGLEALDAILAKSGDTHSILPNSSNTGAKTEEKTPEQLMAETYGDK